MTSQINPQVVSQGTRVEAQGYERTEAKLNPAIQGSSSRQVTTRERLLEAGSVRTVPSNADPLNAKAEGSGSANSEVSSAVIGQAVAKLNDYIQSVQRDLHFRLDEESGKAIISVVDRNSAEVIRQMPGELTLSLAEKLDNEEPLQLFSARV